MKSSTLSGFLAIAIIASDNCAAAPEMAMKSPRHVAAVPAKTVHAESAWVRAAPPGAMMLAGYMTLHNDGAHPIRLVSAECDAFGMVELHRTQLVHGVSTMRPAGDQVIPSGGGLQIQPGGLHLMLMQPRRELKAGNTVRFRLHFADGSALDVVASVRMQTPAAAH